jgi:murein DD-endopeptidase MepM/ murein hydrolase activator NlpD
VAQASGELQALLRGYTGEDPGTGEIVWPVDGPVLLGFEVLWGSRYPGVDIGVHPGAAVHAADWGKVVFSGKIAGYGRLVCVQHTQDLSTCYGRLSGATVRKGQSVDSGEVIAHSDCKDCYAPHLHFEVRESGRPVNPRPYLGSPLDTGG